MRLVILSLLIIACNGSDTFNHWEYPSRISGQRQRWNDLLFVYKDKKFSFVNKEGNFILPYTFSKFTLAKNFAALKWNGYWGVVDINGSVIIKNKYKRIIPFSSFTTTVAENHNNDWVVINKAGRELKKIPKLSGYIFKDFNEKGIRFQKSNQFLIVNFAGKEQWKYKNGNLDFKDFNNSEWARFCNKEGKYNFVNMKGNMFFQYYYDYAAPAIKNKFLVGNKSGKSISLNVFSKIANNPIDSFQIEGSSLALYKDYFNNGFFILLDDKKYAYYNVNLKKNNLEFKVGNGFGSIMTKFGILESDFANQKGKYSLYEKKVLYYDYNSDFVTKVKDTVIAQKNYQGAFYYMPLFANKKAFFPNSFNSFTCYSEEGKKLFDLKNALYVGTFGEDLCPVKFKEGWHYINKEGEKIFDVSNYDFCQPFVSGTAFVYKKEKDNWQTFVIDKKGKRIQIKQ